MTKQLLHDLRDLLQAMSLRALKHQDEVLGQQVREAAALVAQLEQHELLEFKPCSFGDGGFYWPDGADRAVCSCGWRSAAIQRDKQALIRLWEIHKHE
jgi:hypothetical protein